MILGIDPGLTGATAIIGEDGRWINVIDMPTMAAGQTGRRQIHAAELARVYRLVAAEVTMVYLEQVAARPGQGVCSMFSFGQSYGIVLGVLAALDLPYALVPPRVWKQAYRLGADKEQARARAIQLYPTAPLSRKKDSGRAEALLLARWGWQQQRGETPPQTGGA